MDEKQIKLAIDIGGTFTDVALDVAGRLITTKIATTANAPAEGVMQGVSKVMSLGGIEAPSVSLFIHGTTLATNALIERKGAKTALIATQGHRDSVEMAYENRFEQYDLNIDRPQPLVPRYLRWTVKERVDAHGKVLIPLDSESVPSLFALIEKHQVESVAIGLLHAYANHTHEMEVARILKRRFPHLPISLSSEICPEIREYERQSTTCANAYVQPMMANYLRELEQKLKQYGLNCPLFVMTSGGGITTLQAAIKFPIRLVESGPAGGAILASHLARSCGLDRVLAYDMGGTTAKICLIDDGKPLLSRTFEVGRVYQHRKGSGLPIKIPVVEMVEIGTGGGSLASIDRLGRIAVGPHSAGAYPGPACYDKGGIHPTVTDADVVLGRIDANTFAGGSLPLKEDLARRAICDHVGVNLDMDATAAAFGIVEIADEDMANAARVHAIERGKELSDRTMIAFGGAAPLHAARIAQKLNIKEIIIPRNASVGSAVGFLQAPIAFEVVRSCHQLLSSFDCEAVNELLKTMRDEADSVIAEAVGDRDLTELRTAYMRYVGQGHEVDVPIPICKLTPQDVDVLTTAFETAYENLFARTIPNADIEVLTWAVSLQTKEFIEVVSLANSRSSKKPKADGQRSVFDPTDGGFVVASVYVRDDLEAGGVVQGPALITEAQTTTFVPQFFRAHVDDLGNILMTRVQ
ncbi:MAG: hydantoinase/oxoprolinase family protein [Gammaproteobacteria bacterium]|nr:hydantoinase/oxoprolinase family protein [Gammaproteobacteria bacterium]